MLPGALTARLRGVRDALLDGLVERDDAVRLALLAALAGEHVLLLGPPGTAKSLVARRLYLAFQGASYFERLLTRFTVPEELFGPLSIKGLEEDRYERLTASYLPRASIAFLDEIFKANSAILNALLTLLNEREFDNGAVREKVPLVAVIGASNELPEGMELEALFDRFLIRLHVGPVSRENFPTLLLLRGHLVPTLRSDQKLHTRDLDAVHAVADRVELPDDVVALLCELRQWSATEGIRVSDRRWRKVVKLLQVSAATNGRSRVSIWDCWLLQHCIGDRPEVRENVCAWYADRVGASAAMDPAGLTTLVVVWEAQLKADEESRSQMRNEQGQPLFKELDGKHTTNSRGAARATRDSDPLYLAPDRAYAREYGDEIKDRSRDGKGYTRAELDQLYVGRSRNDTTAFLGWTERDAYLANQQNWLTKDADLTPALEPSRHKQLYIAAALGQLEQLTKEVDEYRSHLLAHMETVEQEIGAHLWVPAAFSTVAARNLQATRRKVETLVARVEGLRKGFQQLPIEQPPRADAAVPASESAQSALSGRGSGTTHCSRDTCRHSGPGLSLPSIERFGAPWRRWMWRASAELNRSSSTLC